MTDRRPDVHCTGCGAYCHSLSPDPRKREFPKNHYCGTCSEAIARRVRSGNMLNYAWLRKSGAVRGEFEKTWRRLGKNDQSTISSFVWIMYNQVTPQERHFKDDPNEMTVAEWQEIARAKLAKYKKGCTRTELTVLNNFIKAAAQLDAQRGEKAA